MDQLLRADTSSSTAFINVPSSSFSDSVLTNVEENDNLRIAAADPIDGSMFSHFALVYCKKNDAASTLFTS